MHYLLIVLLWASWTGALNVVVGFKTHSANAWRSSRSRSCSSSGCRLQAAKGTDASRAAALEVVRQATLQRTGEKATIASAIEQLENTTTPSSVTVDDVRGEFELVWSSLIPAGFFPVQEVANFFGYSLTSRWGPVPLGGFYGDWEVTSSTKPAVIKFTTTVFRLGPLSIPLKGKVRSYTFLHADDDVVVARSSTGGGTLLRRL
jgi:hypothetical protein